VDILKPALAGGAFLGVVLFYSMYFVVDVRLWATAARSMIQMTLQLFSSLCQLYRKRAALFCVLFPRAHNLSEEEPVRQEDTTLCLGKCKGV
jgi:hypothetical protein